MRLFEIVPGKPHRDNQIAIRAADQLKENGVGEVEVVDHNDNYHPILREKGSPVVLALGSIQIEDHIRQLVQARERQPAAV